jgi:hypothetical protein
LDWKIKTSLYFGLFFDGEKAQESFFSLSLRQNKKGKKDNLNIVMNPLDGATTF